MVELTAMATSPPRLIPDEVRDYAKRWNGGLSRITFPGSYAADDEKLIPYLAEVNQGNESQAITSLADALAWSPTRLWHPYAQSQFLHLFRLSVSFQIPKTVLHS
jgi:hypothetical protein